MRNHIEDGMGFSGLVPDAQERSEEMRVKASPAGHWEDSRGNNHGLDSRPHDVWIADTPAPAPAPVHKCIICEEEYDNNGWCRCLRRRLDDLNSEPAPAPAPVRNENELCRDCGKRHGCDDYKYGRELACSDFGFVKEQAPAPAPMMNRHGIKIEPAPKVTTNERRCSICGGDGYVLCTESGHHKCKICGGSGSIFDSLTPEQDEPRFTVEEIVRFLAQHKKWDWSIEFTRIMLNDPQDGIAAMTKEAK